MKMVKTEAKENLKFDLYDWCRVLFFAIDAVLCIATLGCWLCGDLGDISLASTLCLMVVWVAFFASNALFLYNSLCEDVERCPNAESTEAEK